MFATVGVDLVLNSLAEEKLQASVRCLAQHGRFLEIGKFDLSNNHPLGMTRSQEQGWGLVWGPGASHSEQDSRIQAWPSS